VEKEARAYPEEEREDEAGTGEAVERASGNRDRHVAKITEKPRQVKEDLGS
jgi:hypothetical protein